MPKNNTAAMQTEGVPGFDWGSYSDGWNGKSLKRNNRVKTKKNDRQVTVLSHEKYAASTYRKYLEGNVEAKEIKTGDVLAITDLRPMDDTHVMATVKGGANNIVIDLEKEGRYLQSLQFNGEAMSKEVFNACLRNDQIKERIISMGISVRVGTDAEKASIWDGFVESLNRELLAQIEKPTRGYIARVIDFNSGGLIVEISNAVRAFLPSSLIATSHQAVEAFEDYVGKDLEVMVETFRPGRGFIVSRKKFINAVLPGKIAQLAETLEADQDKPIVGKITGFAVYGIFVQIDQYITGMLHKSLVSDTLREIMRDNQGELNLGDTIEVYVHRIDDTRVILSDVPSDQRDEVIARREAEDEAEKAAIAAEQARLEAEKAAEAEAAENERMARLADTFMQSTTATIDITVSAPVDVESIEVSAGYAAETAEED